MKFQVLLIKGSRITEVNPAETWVEVMAFVKDLGEWLDDDRYSIEIVNVENDPEVQV